MSKTKEVYQTLKRSISATTNGIMSSSLLKGSGGSSQLHKDPGARWIHPPDSLIRGRVDYGVKFLGQTEVAEPKGTYVVRDAIHSIRFQVQVNRSIASSAACKPKKVEIQINIHGVTVVDSKTKMIIHRHPLNKISFCADDNQDKRVFAYIASNDENKNICYLFLSDKLAEQITLTIGEAFDLALQQYIDRRNVNVVQTEDVEKLKERIAELESENRGLRVEVEFLRKKCGVQDDTYRPTIPDTPIPKLPPPAFRSIEQQQNSAPVVPLAPPPSSSNRRGTAAKTDQMQLVDIDMGGPDVGRKLENLQIDKMDNVFDDDFDPRAGEKKDSFGLDPFVVPQASGTDKQENGGDTHAENLKAMLDEVDTRIHEICGFARGSLELGDLGDIEVLSAEDEYVVPSSKKQSTSNNSK